MNLLYALIKNNEIVYIGRTKNMFNLNARIYSHRRQGKDFDTCKYVEVGDYELLKTKERELIKKYKPKYNRQCLPNKIRYNRQGYYTG